ncbi:MAG TPA: histidine phosphatase family protein [Acidimicrobiales bacterium]|nr:histidine phosphatase family protein [Acidimicrobiales bacterium]
MPRITMVRHGKAAAGWEDTDPPLDDTGRAQAEAMAAVIGGSARPLFTSPLRRTRETASALERLWGVTAAVEPRVGEVVAPDEFDVATRVNWLRGFLAGTYSDAGDAYCAWRDDVLTTLRALPDDSVVVSHFVAINVAIGKAWGDDRVVCQPVDNCSCTTIDIDAASDEWRVVELGNAASTVVN